MCPRDFTYDKGEGRCLPVHLEIFRTNWLSTYCQKLKQQQVRCEKRVRNGISIHSSPRELWGSQLDREAPAHTSVQRGVTHPAAGAWLHLHRSRQIPNLLFTAFSLSLPLCQGQWASRTERTTESQREWYKWRGEFKQVLPLSQPLALGSSFVEAASILKALLLIQVPKTGHLGLFQNDFFISETQIFTEHFNRFLMT